MNTTTIERKSTIVDYYIFRFAPALSSHKLNQICIIFAGPCEPVLRSTAATSVHIRRQWQQCKEQKEKCSMLGSFTRTRDETTRDSWSLAGNVGVHGERVPGKNRIKPDFVDVFHEHSLMLI